MSLLKYTEAPFRFSKKFRYCTQYRVTEYSDLSTLNNFLTKYATKTGIYVIETNKGSKVGVSSNLRRRFKEHITAWSEIKSVSFITFNSCPMSVLRNIESKVISHYKDKRVDGCNEFFSGVSGLECFNSVRYNFYKSIPKKFRPSDTKVIFKYKTYSGTPKFTSTSPVVKDLLNDFYSKE